MWRYVGLRLLSAVPLLLVVSLIVFVLLSLAPGDPAVLMLGADATPEKVQETRQALGLNDPLYIQYFNFLKSTVRGDFGNSFQTGRPVLEDVARTFPVTAELSLVAIAISSVVGVAVGVLSAVNQYSLLDNIIRVVVLAGVSMPIFWLGLMLIVVFSVYLGLLPSSGWGAFRYMVLPAVSLATFPLAMITRLTRSSMLEVIRQDYIRTARSKGLSVGLVILRHGLRNALIPVVTVIGLQFGVLLAGAVLTETVFAIPGIGRLTVTAVFARDYPVIRACILLTAAIFVLVNLLVDLSYTYLDPRIRYD
ncbi:MAG: ABC transporter permease [Actinobacteria bacterium]|nr:ABC transporter permease [Actinomycetota bacterium]